MSANLPLSKIEHEIEQL
jgi:hypothetical protein